MKENEEAEATYNEAVANNTTAFLGEETKADIFKVFTNIFSHLKN